MRDLRKIEERIKFLQSELKRLKEKEEKRKLHYLITIIKSTVLDDFNIVDLEIFANFLKRSSKNKSLDAVMRDVNKSFVELFEKIKKIEKQNQQTQIPDN